MGMIGKLKNVNIELSFDEIKDKFNINLHHIPTGHKKKYSFSYEIISLLRAMFSIALSHKRAGNERKISEQLIEVDSLVGIYDMYQEESKLEHLETYKQFQIYKSHRNNLIGLIPVNYPDLTTMVYVKNKQAAKDYIDYINLKTYK